MQEDVFEVYSRQGLPNLRNTCHLNSIIQLLFSSRQFKILIFQKKSQQNFPLACALKEIFQQMFIMDQQIEKEKKQTLQKIIRLFHEKNKNVNCHSQQDLFQILLLLLNQLFEEDPRFQQMFLIQFQSICDCGNFKMKSYFLQNSNQKCLGCNKEFKKRLLSQNKLMLIQNNLLKPQKKALLQFNDKILYQCLSKVFYQGNSLSGHYTASRICNQSQVFIEFSDMCAFKDEGLINPIFMLYQKTSYDGVCPGNVKIKEKSKQKKQKDVLQLKVNKQTFLDKFKKILPNFSNNQDTSKIYQLLFPFY